MNEDKQAICDILCAALQLTKAYGDVKRLEHHIFSRICEVYHG